MPRPTFSFPFAEWLGVIGIIFGAWLIHSTFQPYSDTPSYSLLLVGAIDILLCFAYLGYLLRGRLRESEPLPRSWIIGGAVVIAGFLGWIAALFVDSDRILQEQRIHQEYVKDAATLEASLRHFVEVTATGQRGAIADPVVNKEAWNVNHANYVRLQHHFQERLRGKAPWDKELADIDSHVHEMETLYQRILAEDSRDQRIKLRAEFQGARKQAVSQAEKMRTALSDRLLALADVYRTRWHGVGAAALTTVVLLVGCLLFWLLFDHELRRIWRALARLSDSEARFRSLVENYSEPIAVLDMSANILYSNQAWKKWFPNQANDLARHNLLELVHPQDQLSVRTALQANGPMPDVECRLSIAHDHYQRVELDVRPHVEIGGTVICLREAKDLPPVPIQPQPDLLAEAADRCKNAENQLAELERECERLRVRETRSQAELQHERWLLASHREANADGVLILSAKGEIVSWNSAFARLWRLSPETITGHTLPTIAAHMETQVQSGWEEFRRTLTPGNVDSPQDDVLWEMTLESGRTMEVHASLLRDENHTPTGVNFHFHDVTYQKGLQTQLLNHQQQINDWHDRLSDHQKHLRQLERQLHERENHRQELEKALREHQDLLHQAQDAASEATKSNKENLHRLANGVGDELNSIFSVMLGNTEVLRDNLPPDHIAQKYLEDIHHAGLRGTRLSQRLIALAQRILHENDVPLDTAIDDGIDADWSLPLPEVLDKSPSTEAKSKWKASA